MSRRFVELSAKRLWSFLSRRLGELGLWVVCIDGKVFRDYCMVVALGIDTQGRKHVLGLREGTPETAAVATGLLSDLVPRGLPTDRTLLFVIDGVAEAVRKDLEETLTVKRLGLTGALERTLRRTNIIQNLMGSLEGDMRRVRWWRGGQSIQRWVASVLVEAEPRFQRVRGCRDLRYLVDALAPPACAVADAA